MIQQVATAWAAPDWLIKLGFIVLFYAAAYIVYRLTGRLVRRVMRIGGLADRQQRMRKERQTTISGLIASGISLLAFITATLASLSLFVGANTLVWMVGLFSAAFGLSVRPLVNDFLTGVSFIFEDTYDVGEKVELLGVEGVVEAVNLRTTLMRSPTGELYVVPNGDIRVIRNFSRGRFSQVRVTIKISAGDLSQALPLLEDLGSDAVQLLPNLLEPWQVLSETGAMGQQTELTILAKARFGKGAEMRPRLLTLVHERLAEAGMELAA